MEIKKARRPLLLTWISSCTISAFSNRQLIGDKVLIIITKLLSLEAFLVSLRKKKNNLNTWFYSEISGLYNVHTILSWDKARYCQPHYTPIPTATEQVWSKRNHLSLSSFVASLLRISLTSDFIRTFSYFLEVYSLGGKENSR